jgi:hypothetical protein
MARRIGVESGPIETLPSLFEGESGLLSEVIELIRGCVLYRPGAKPDTTLPGQFHELALGLLTLRIVA